MMQNIVVAVDGSTGSQKALELGCELAKRFSAKLSVVTVVQKAVEDHIAKGFGRPVVLAPANPAVIEETGRPLIDAASALVEERGYSLSHADVVGGSPAKQILAYAEEQGMDTIIMGSRGLSDLKGLLMGSVSHKVSHLTRCTCIVVR